MHKTIQIADGSSSTTRTVIDLSDPAEGGLDFDVFSIREDLPPDHDLRCVCLVTVTMTTSEVEQLHTALGEALEMLHAEKK